MKIAGTFPVTLYRDYEALSTALFYGKMPISIYKSASHDLAWGQNARPNSPQFAESLNSNALPSLFLVRRQRKAEFEAEFPTYKSLYEDKNSTLYRAPETPILWEPPSSPYPTQAEEW